MLLFTSDATANFILNHVPVAVMVTQETEAESLRRGDERPQSAQFTVFVVTDRLVVRSTDFRAPTTGMAIVVDRGLESAREAT